MNQEGSEHQAQAWPARGASCCHGYRPNADTVPRGQATEGMVAAHLMALWNRARVDYATVFAGAPGTSVAA